MINIGANMLYGLNMSYGFYAYHKNQTEIIITIVH